MSDTQFGSLLVVIIAVCQAAKYAGLNSRWIPLLSLVLGLSGAVYVGGAVNWLSILAGLVTSFTASGMFSAFKKTVLNK